MSVTHTYNRIKNLSDNKISACRPAAERAAKSNPVWNSLAVRPLSLQPKLKVSEPADAEELEADHLADRVMRMEVATSSSNGSPENNATVQRKCNECEEEEEVSRKDDSASDHAREAAPSIVHETLNSPGQPLDAVTRAFMESRFERRFGDVRIHTGDRATQSAELVGALAYTVGRNIVFGEERYAPHTRAGQRLLAHELAHVTQQDSGRFQIARQTPAPAPPVSPPTPKPPPMPEEKKKTEEPAPAPAPEEQKTSKKRAPMGTTGTFKGNPTSALAKWDYVVYQDHVRLGNRKVDDSPGGPVIGSWPWLTNNPGDLTGDVRPRKEVPDDPNSSYRQDKRVWGEPVQRGKTPDSLGPVAGSAGLSASNTAVPGYAARGDLAIFATRERGRGALKEWIQKYYANVTLAESVKLHLGPASSHVAGVDDPEKYPKLLQQYLSDHGYPADYVRKTKGADVKEEHWKDVIDAFGYAEGYSSRRAVAGKPGTFQYVENKGIIYRCSGKDPIDVDPAYAQLSRVKNLPPDVPPEIKDLLGCE